MLKQKGGMWPFPLLVLAAGTASVGGFHRQRVHRYEGASLARGVETDLPVGEGEERMVAAEADILAWVIGGAPLPHEDVAGEHDLAAELLHPEAAAFGVASVARRTACFLMGHGACSLILLGAQPVMSVMRSTVSAWRWPFLRR